MAGGVNVPNSNTSYSIYEIIQQNVTLRFALYGGLLLFIVQVALSRFAPGFGGYRWYSFFLLSLIGLTGGVCGMGLWHSIVANWKSGWWGTKGSGGFRGFLDRRNRRASITDF